MNDKEQETIGSISYQEILELNHEKTIFLAKIIEKKGKLTEQDIKEADRRFPEKR